MRLWLVRHAPVPLAPGLCYGASDIAAEPHGTAECARRLASILPPLTPLRCSPLQRCRSLAQALAARRPDLVATTDPRLAEMDFGAWEGEPWKRIGQRAVDAWMDDFLHHRPGGGESVDEFMQRVALALQDCRREGAADVAWITHAGVIKAVRALACRSTPIARASDWPAESVACGAWVVLTLAPPTGG